MSKASPSVYRAILRQAWKISWHERMMWVLGLFSAFIATGGAVDILTRHIDWILNPVPWKLDYLKMSMSWNWNVAAVIWSVVLFLMLFGLFSVLVFLIIRAFLTLIKVVDVYKEGSQVDIAKVWHENHDKFWSILATVVLFKVLAYAFVVLSLIPLWGFALGYLSDGWVWLYPVVFLLGVFGSLICSFLIVFASSYIVLHQESFGGSIRKSWDLFAKHWLITLEIAILIFAINFISGVLVLFGVILIFVPVGIVYLIGLFYSLQVLSSTGILLGLLLSTMLILWVAGFLGTFHTTTWTLMFKKMSEEDLESKLVRTVKKILGRF